MSERTLKAIEDGHSASTRMGRAIQQHPLPHITVGVAVGLIRLCQRDLDRPVTFSALAAVCPTSNVSYSVRPLCSAGLIEAVARGGDGRLRHYRITELCRQWAEAVRGELDRLEREAGHGG